MVTGGGRQDAHQGGGAGAQEKCLGSLFHSMAREKAWWCRDQYVSVCNHVLVGRSVCTCVDTTVSTCVYSWSTRVTGVY